MFKLFNHPRSTLPQVQKNDLITINLLGKGRFGEVHFGCFKGEPVAIKKLLNNSPAENEAEIKLHASLSHPNIVSAFARYDSPENDVYLILEFMNGKDLFDCLVHDEQKTMLSLRMRVSIAKNIIDALTYLHETVHILHRDIKPENILLNQHMQAKLCDFGLALSIDDSNQTRSSGTPDYAAPELFITGARNTTTTDNYALGVTIFVLMTITPPSELHTIDIDKRMMLHVNAVPLDIAKAFKNLVLNSTAHNPRDRMSLSDMSKLTDAIESLLNTIQPLSHIAPDETSVPTEHISDAVDEVSDQLDETSDYSCGMS
tara:strand:- start:55022 stop:55969 length:948 start_codon:yes stop_codon:yes gene_type:complete